MYQQQSLSGYVRQHLVEFEDRLAVGVRQDVMVRELKALGYETTVDTLRVCLYRARHRSTKNNQFVKEQKSREVVAKKQAEIKPQSPPNPLTKKTGFDYKGMLGYSEKDLI